MTYLALPPYNRTLSLCPDNIVGDSAQYPHIFYILYLFLLNKLTFCHGFRVCLYLLPYLQEVDIFSRY